MKFATQISVKTPNSKSHQHTLNIFLDETYGLTWNLATHYATRPPLKYVNL